jgi:hypothetical protein
MESFIKSLIKEFKLILINVACYLILIAAGLSLIFCKAYYSIPFSVVCIELAYFLKLYKNYLK